MIKLFNYLRIVPDVVFGAGGIVILLFVIRAAWMSFSRKRVAAK